MILNFLDPCDNSAVSLPDQMIAALNPRNSLEEALARDIALAATRLRELRKIPVSAGSLEVESQLRADWLDTIDTYYSIRRSPEFPPTAPPSRKRRPRGNHGLQIVTKNTTTTPLH